MEDRVRVLGIAPYEGMKALMLELRGEYPRMDLTVFTGDREHGLEIAKNNFHGNYDVVVSRGGTADMLRREMALPVVEIEFSVYDILRALKLLGGATGRIAIISAADLTHNAKMLCDLMGYDPAIYTYQTRGEAEGILLHLQNERCQAILGDMMVNTIAMRLGLNSFLVVSSADSLRKAFDQAMFLCQSQRSLRNENRFFREVIQGQLGQTLVFDGEDHLLFSTLDAPEPELLGLLRRELPVSREEPERRLIRNVGGKLYSVRSRRIDSEGLPRVTFYVDTRKAPISPNRVGIRFVTRPEAEDSFHRSVFCLAGSLGAFELDMDKLCQSAAPVVLAGEDGTGKESAASLLYIRGPLSKSTLVTINCSLLNDRSWRFLLEHHNSPLADEGNTLYFTSVDVLGGGRCGQLLATLAEMCVCRRNRVLFSCVCQRGEYISEVGARFRDEMCCLSLHLPPLRDMAERIPALVNLALSALNTTLPRHITRAEPEALALLQEFPWPRNYTQFSRVVGELAITAPGPVITAASVRRLLRKERHAGAFAPLAENATAPLDLNRTMEAINRDVARRVVEETGGNQTAAAKRLGLSRTTLWRLLQK